MAQTKLRLKSQVMFNVPYLNFPFEDTSTFPQVSHTKLNPESFINYIRNNSFDVTEFREFKLLNLNLRNMLTTVWEAFSWT